MSGNEIEIRKVGSTGRITLNRPKALNALTYEQALAIEEALDAWQAQGDIKRIVIDAMGEKAFCAGGDLSELYRRGVEGDYAYGRRFWADEYRLNAKIANCAIPYIAFMDGITMGGGVGISAHGSHRVVTDRSMIAMPECGIGLVPDVGGTLLLARAAGHLGEFLALTGWRMTGADAIRAGFADLYIDSADVPAAIAALEEGDDLEPLSANSSKTDEAPLSANQNAIDQHFQHKSAKECLASLEADPSEFAQEAAAMMRKACPLSVACAFEMIRKARDFSRIEEALALEYRFTYRSMSDGDFLEGVRALIIEKDRQPKWRIERLGDVGADHIETMLAGLGSDELTLEKRTKA
ncbi:enoyl-CoA hydratase/isomerase family protein [Notoacmeibacter ruber]|uniref:3-hydroxyisobutyryl-CoA hydrolase n=1 Tax=Notoacmeibacter ruber TaxID=2670375 RepID=A0A3L7JAF1_9HYPH|nr:enoyl-CoA hydratase/isomerase family protein [Notoacmeibacter ruber]RLQ87404.1 enoyl-CoA hydratase/isomerase family protein [Notoacmeibacter ruber]